MLLVTKVVLQLQDPALDRRKAAEACKFFAAHHRPSQPELADKLDDWAGIFSASDQPAQSNMTPYSVQEQPSDPTTPPGLKNIGNTCYLNSLLQYLYTVTPVRDLVLKYPQNSLELTLQSVEQRRLGYGNGITVSLDEAIIGRQCKEYLAANSRPR